MNDADANLIADAMNAHDHEDWYTALLLQAIDQTKTVKDGITLADRVYEENPQDVSEPSEDDMEAVFGEGPS